MDHAPPQPPPPLTSLKQERLLSPWPQLKCIEIQKKALLITLFYTLILIAGAFIALNPLFNSHPRSINTPGAPLLLTLFGSSLAPFLLLAR